MLYNVVIQPIEYILEIIFTLMYRFFGNAGWALFGVSIGVSFLTLPLYMRADAVQEKQKQKEKNIKKWADHIKKTFKGDEKFMMLETYYRQQNYHQLQSIQGIFPLFLQIPFFIAAYHYLSTLSLLQGYSFGPFADLGAEDRLIVIAGVGINVLPILMTAINYVSSAIYTKGLPLKDKLQPYLLALVFLVLLYRSPSGLVLYWTLNNIFSLIKNFVMKYVKKPKRLLAFMACIAGNLFIIFSFINGKISYLLAVKDYETLLIYGVIYAVSYLPIIGLYSKKKNNVSAVSGDNKGNKKSILIVLLTLSMLCGAMIPLSVVGDAPLEFVDIYHYRSPLYFIGTTLCIYLGLFLFWGGIIYWVCGEKEKITCEKIFYILLFIFVLNNFFFCADVGAMSTELYFDYYPKFSKIMKLINLILIMIPVGLIFIFWNKIKKYLRGITALLLISMTVISVKDYIGISSALKTVTVADSFDDEERVIPLSKEGNNVIVLMLDRAIGAYIPFMFDERPELKEQFDGFTGYPNTVSFGGYTIIGSPGLFGGYDYTPENVDARDTEPLSEKFIEAQMVLPKVFEDDNCKITLCDLPYAGYNDLQDFSVFDGIKNTNAFHLEAMMSQGYTLDEIWNIMKRNFAFYSLYRTSATILQDDIYDNGNYLCAVSIKHTGLPTKFLNSYFALKSLEDISVVEEGNENTLFMYDNNIVHEPAVLQLPDYTVTDTVDNSGYDLFAPKEVDGVTMYLAGEGDFTAEFAAGHYHANMAALMALGEWFDWMREHGVYDNTRIILVSDHGRNLKQFPDRVLPDGTDSEHVNAFLMVKDFNSTGFTIDYSFMTNADTAAFAVQGIIENPVNPFTGNPINMDGKIGGVNVVVGGCIDLTYGNGFEYNGAPWYHVKDNMFDPNNWVLLDK